MCDAPARPARLPGLDRLRGAALLLMLVHHLTSWLVGDAAEAVPGWRTFPVTAVAAPAFAVAAGASAWLLRLSRLADGESRRSVLGTVARRYGLLIPIGVALVTVVFGDPGRFRVLEVLGVSVLVAYLIAEALPERLLVAAGIAALTVAPLIEAAASGHTGWLAENVLAGKFPLGLYIAFALTGMAGATLLREGDRPRPALVIGAVLAVLSVLGGIPDRYPGDASFVLPGLAGTFLLYGLLAGPYAPLDRLLTRAGRHTLGVFVAHYGVLLVVREAGLTGSFPPAVGLAVAVVVAAGLALMAPLMPKPSWSLRTGRRRLRRPSPEPRRELVGAAAGHTEAGGDGGRRVAG
jgi:hypothetical protein